MVRKTDQRVINHKHPKDTQTEVITMETIQTYKGHKPDRTVVIKKRDLSANAVLCTSAMSDRDHGYSSITPTPSRTLKTDISKDLSSMSLLTPDEPSYNSNPNSPNNNTRKSILNMATRDANNNPYGTPTMYTKHNRNAINSRIQHENSITKSTVSLRNSHSPGLRNSPGFRYSTPSPVNRRSIYNDFELDCLKAHNEYRARHGVPPLKLNKRLCKHAEEWARILASRGILLHRNNSAYGENIFCSWSSNVNNNHVTGREPVDHWYSEITNHIFQREPTTLKTGHFTQVGELNTHDNNKHDEITLL
jgi:glioma pathogenesis-related protein 2